MSDGNDVYLVGAGMTRFGIHMERDVRSLCEEAIYEAMTDAGPILTTWT